MSNKFDMIDPSSDVFNTVICLLLSNRIEEMSCAALL